MTIKEMRKSLGDTQTDFSRRYHIPFRTIQNWEAGVNSPPAYVEELLERQIKTDLINRRQFQVPKWSSDKKQLPGNNQYMEPVEWLRAVRQELGSDIVFALDSALMCEGAYLGRTDEWVIWIYGNPKLEKYNGVCVIGDSVSDHEVETRNGLRYTCFNRTLNDSLANESILDMQGITEALSRYYSTHQDSFTGIFPDPEYSAGFERLAEDARSYYEKMKPHREGFSPWMK